MTTGRPPWRLTRQPSCKQSVRISARGLEPGPGGGRLHGQVPLDTIFRDVLTGQRTSDLKKADGNGESLETPKTQETPDPETPDEPGSPDGLATTPDDPAAAPDDPAATPDDPAATPDDPATTPDEPATTPDEPATRHEPATRNEPVTPDEPEAPKARRGFSRRQALTVLGIGAGALIAEQVLVADGIPPASGPALQASSAPPEPGGY